ncbi:MAG: hypothetical protein M3P41_00345 [Actinomycetota bacterium]|nr:hypothetical protein [Actinomycetota bacterium]
MNCNRTPAHGQRPLCPVPVFFGHGITWLHTAQRFLHVFAFFTNASSLGQFIVLPFFFLFNRDSTRRS